MISCIRMFVMISNNIHRPLKKINANTSNIYSMFLVVFMFSMVFFLSIEWQQSIVVEVDFNLGKRSSKELCNQP